ncbi:MAG: molybdopterin-dependent oxidoreductase [Phycisphaerales bacterium]
MPTITIDGQLCEFEPGELILQVANRNKIEIPQYCYHEGLSVVASCRICLAEVWAPNPRNDNKLEPIPKLLPTCQTTCGDGQVVYTNSPKAIQNQKAVMEYLLINHPLDCPVCDQSGECFLQDYSYEYGRGVSRFEEAKVKQPKKDLGPHVYLYADRCIMCSRCVRFTREVTGTSELIVEGRGNQEQIDIFPGEALDNELSANVIDLCPVGALLDKDFLFTQRVWFLKTTPSIDGITASGDNISVEHNNGTVYRFKPRTNPAVNKWWISDEIRYGWKFAHREDRLSAPIHTRFGKRVTCDWERAYDEAIENLRGKSIALLVSPMLPCEEAYALASLALSLDPNATLGVGPIPTQGEDKTVPGGYTIRAEKAPNARGVRRVLEALAGGKKVLNAEEFCEHLRSRGGESGAAIITGNYPSDWATDALVEAVKGAGYAVLLDTLPSRLSDAADLVLPSATWLEKSGAFENATGRLQSFHQAIPARPGAKSEGQIALDLQAVLDDLPLTPRPEAHAIVIDAMPGQVPAGATTLLPRADLAYNAADLRTRMSEEHESLRCMATEVHHPAGGVKMEAEVAVVEL